MVPRQNEVENAGSNPVSTARHVSLPVFFLISDLKELAEILSGDAAGTVCCQDLRAGGMPPAVPLQASAKEDPVRR